MKNISKHANVTFLSLDQSQSQKASENQGCRAVSCMCTLACFTGLTAEQFSVSTPKTDETRTSHDPHSKKMKVPEWPKM